MRWPNDWRSFCCSEFHSSLTSYILVEVLALLVDIAFELSTLIFCHGVAALAQLVLQPCDLGLALIKFLTSRELRFEFLCRLLTVFGAHDGALHTNYSNFGSALRKYTLPAMHATASTENKLRLISMYFWILPSEV